MAFGKRSGTPNAAAPAAPKPAAPVAQPRPQAAKPKVPDPVPVKGAPKPIASQPAKVKPPEVKPEPVRKVNQQSEQYYATKTTIFNALIDTIDLSQLAQLDAESAREEIRDIVVEIISIKNVVMSISEQEQLLDDICNDVLGYGPLEPLLARDDIADIMVNGADTTYIEVNGKIERTNIRFRDNAQLMNICQRIVSQVGRRVDESSPICDARLLDGSRVNVIAPPLAIDGPTLTIRKFKKDKLQLQDLVNFGSISEAGAEVLRIIGHSRCNVLISGGTGSGKTTLLNCLTAFIEPGERVITCEDSAELQLQQPHVVRLETRPPNIEGSGEITMRELVKNTMGGFSLPAKTIREMIVGSIDIVVQASRLRDGSRRIMCITEVMGMEGDTIVLQDVLKFEMDGEDADGKIIGAHRGTGVGRPRFWERASYYNLERELASALDALGS